MAQVTGGGSMAKPPSDTWDFPAESFAAGGTTDAPAAGDIADEATADEATASGATPSEATTAEDTAAGDETAARIHGHDGHEPHEGSAFDHLEQPSWAEFQAGWDIYQAPVYCGMLAGAVLGLLSVFVVLRRAVFVTATISQAAGLGVALAFYAAIHWSLAFPPVLGALVLSLVVTATLALRSPRSKLPRESVLGFAYLAASAGAVLVGDRISQEAHDISAILFGSAVLVSPGDLLQVLIVGVAVTACVVLAYRGFVFVGFDPESARVQGLPVRLLESLLWVLLALEVSVTARAIGALPVFAFAVIPGMTALLLAPSLPGALMTAAMLGGAAGGLGYLAAFFLEFPVGACQTAFSALLFALVLAIRSVFKHAPAS